MLVRAMWLGEETRGPLDAAFLSSSNVCRGDERISRGYILGL